MAAKKDNNKQEQSKPQKPVEALVKAQPVVAPQNNNLDRDAKKELQRLQRKFQQTEEQIGKLNKQKEETEQKLSEPTTYANPKIFADTEATYKKITTDLNNLNKQYEELFEQIMEMEEGLK